MTEQPSQIDRRTMLKRGAIIGGAVAWAVPVIQVVSMTPAHAATASAPFTVPQPNGRDENPGNHYGRDDNPGNHYGQIKNG